MKPKKRNGSRDRMVKMEPEMAKRRIGPHDSVHFDPGTPAKVVVELCDCPQCERERRE
jgi:hypothetical protein